MVSGVLTRCALSTTSTVGAWPSCTVLLTAASSRSESLSAAPMSIHANRRTSHAAHSESSVVLP